jgi:hypothetical protein
MKALSQLLFDTRPVAKRRRRGGCDIPTSAVHLEFLMHRVSSVWKENPRKEEGALGGAITNWQQNLAKGNNNHHSNNNKNDLQLLRYSWERSHKVWPAITMFLFVFTVCLIMIPELLDSVSLEARRSADLVTGSFQPGEQDSARLMISELSRSSVLDVAPEIAHGAVRGVQGWAGTGLQDDVQKDILLPPSGKISNPPHRPPPCAAAAFVHLFRFLFLQESKQEGVDDCFQHSLSLMSRVYYVLLLQTKFPISSGLPSYFIPDFCLHRWGFFFCF